MKKHNGWSSHRFLLVLGPGWGSGESRQGGTKPPPAAAGYAGHIDDSAILQIDLRLKSAVLIMGLRDGSWSAARLLFDLNQAKGS